MSHIFFLFYRYFSVYYKNNQIIITVGYLKIKTDFQDICPASFVPTCFKSFMRLKFYNIIIFFDKKILPTVNFRYLSSFINVVMRKYTEPPYYVLI